MIRKDKMKRTLLTLIALSTVTLNAAEFEYINGHFYTNKVEVVGGVTNIVKDAKGVPVRLLADDAYAATQAKTVDRSTDPKYMEVWNRECQLIALLSKYVPLCGVDPRGSAIGNYDKIRAYAKSKDCPNQQEVKDDADQIAFLWNWLNREYGQNQPPWAFSGQKIVEVTQ